MGFRSWFETAHVTTASGTTRGHLIRTSYLNYDTIILVKTLKVRKSPDITI